MPENSPALTEEEIHILRLVADGWTDKRIARKLGLGRTTVHRRLHRAATALGATSRINLVLRAVEARLIESPAGSEPSPRQGSESGTAGVEE